MFPFKRAILGFSFFAIALLGFSLTAEASHYRGGTLQYRIVSGRTVEITLDTYWRIGQSASGNPSSLTIRRGTTTLGRANRFSASRPTRVGNADRIIVKYRYTFTANGTYNVYWRGCCWISGLRGPAGNNWELTAVIIIDTKPNNDPQFNSPTFFNWCAGIPFQTNLNASDPDGDKITFSLKDFAASPTRVPSPTSPDRLQIDQKGEISWNKPKAGNWVVTVIAKDSRNGTTYRDFMLIVSATCSNKQPVLTLTPPSARTKVGQKVCTVVKAADPNAGQRLDFFVTPTKSNSTPTSIPKSQVAPSTWTYCWTPQAADNLKIHDILFTVLDNGNPRLNRQATFRVSVGIEVAPTITVEPVGTIKTVDEGKTITFKAKAFDPDGNGIASFKMTGPRFCKSTKSGDVITVTCAPGGNDGGKTYNLTFVAIDKDKTPKTGTLIVKLIVNEKLKNRPPTLTNPGDQTVKEKSLLKVGVKATDPDNDKLTFTMKGLPAGAKIDPNTGEITWTPQPKDIGSYTVEVTVTDGFGGKATVKFKVTVTNVNDPPVIVSKPPTTATEDKPYTYSAKATDPDTGDAGKHTWKLLKGPKSAKIDPKTGKVTWTPGDSDAGKEVEFEIEVCDPGKACDKQKWKVKVTNVNDPPVITSKPPTRAFVGKEVKYPATATDPDPNDTQTWSLEKGPAGATIDPKTGELKWTPAKTDAGKDVEFEIKVCDSKKACATQKFKIKVYLECSVDSQCATPEICITDTAKTLGKPTPHTGECKGCGTDKKSWETARNASVAACKSKCTGTCTVSKAAWDNCTFDKALNGYRCTSFCPAVATDDTRWVCKKPGCADQTPKCQNSAEFCKNGTCGKNPCDGKTCGQGEYCNPINGQCIKPCQGVKCQSGEVCMDGKCVKDPCAAAPCKADEYCDDSDAKNPVCKKNPCNKQTCRHGRVCMTQMPHCVDDPCAAIKCPDPQNQRCVAGQCVDRLPCKVDVDCPGEEICVNKLCQPQDCYASQSCKTDEVCKQGKCNPNNCPPNGSVQCKAGEFCRPGDNKCIPSCATVSCGDDERCVDGKCEKNPCFGVKCQGGDICVKGKCEPDNCAASNVCKYGRVCLASLNACIEDPCAGVKCPTKAVCNKVTGQCERPPKCTWDSDCPGLFLCVQNKCILPNCKTNSDCKTGEICSNGKCTKDPCDGKQCKDGEACKAGNCVGSCAGVFCKDKQVCNEGKCVPDVCADKKCGADEICENGKCIKNPCPSDNSANSCKDGRICSSNGCKDNPCNNLKCPTSQTCKNGQCVGDKPCQVDAECPGGAVCVNGKCSKPGCYDKACASGELCIDGNCVPNGCKEKTCNDGEICRPSDGKCIPKCPTCKEGQVCENGTCKDDPCKGITCEKDESCIGGTCKKDACKTNDPPCKSQRVCNDSKCSDDPCLSLKCADGETCKNGTCVTPPKPEPEPEPEPKPEPEPVVDSGPTDQGPTKEYTAQGGCACQSTPFNGFGFGLFLVLFFAAAFRRRLSLNSQD